MKNIIRGFVELKEGIESNLLRLKFCYLDLNNGSKVYFKKEDQGNLNFLLNSIYEDYIDNLLEIEEDLFQYRTHRGLPRGTSFKDIKERVLNKLLNEVSIEESLQKYLLENKEDISFKNKDNTYYFLSDVSFFDWSKWSDKLERSNLNKVKFSYLREV